MPSGISSASLQPQTAQRKHKSGSVSDLSSSSSAAIPSKSAEQVTSARIEPQKRGKAANRNQKTKETDSTTNSKPNNRQDKPCKSGASKPSKRKGHTGSVRAQKPGAEPAYVRGNAKCVKLVVRRLPAGLTFDQFCEVSNNAGFDLNAPENTPIWSRFVYKSKKTRYSVCYLAWSSMDRAFRFSDALNGHTITDPKHGQSFVARVERAPYTKIPNDKATKQSVAALAGTIEEDPDYKEFLKKYNESLNETTIHSMLLPQAALVSDVGAMSINDSFSKKKSVPLDVNGSPKVTPLMLELREKRRERESKSGATAEDKRSKKKSKPKSRPVGSKRKPPVVTEKQPRVLTSQVKSER